MCRPKEFKEPEVENQFIHHMRQRADTKLKLDLLQEFVFLPLDIYRKTKHNKESRIDAWLTFLGEDEPELIMKLINRYPDFREMYEEIYTLCLNTEKVMGMFSKELQELDRNTVQYMIDEMQDTIDRQKQELEDQRKEMDRKLEAQKEEYEKKLAQLEQQLTK